MTNQNKRYYVEIKVEFWPKKYSRVHVSPLYTDKEKANESLLFVQKKYPSAKLGCMGVNEKVQ